METAILFSFVLFLVSSYIFKFMTYTKMDFAKQFQLLLKMAKENKLEYDEIMNISTTYILLSVLLSFTVIGSAIALFGLSILYVVFIFI